MNIDGVKIEWLGHASFRITSHNKVIYIDPYVLDDSDKPADYILITHEHYDHCDLTVISKIHSPDAKIFAPPGCISKIHQKFQIVNPGDSFDEGFMKIKAVPAYNIGKPFHPETIGNGFVLNVSGVKIYHAGDTDRIPEMADLAEEKLDLALLPIGGTYTMDAREAAKAVELIKPKRVMPMHWGKIIGSKEDANRFKELVGDKAEVIILE